MTRRFAMVFAVLLLLLGAGWYALSLGEHNPLPWTIVSVWGDMISVGMGVEQMLGYVPSDGRGLPHAAIVVGSAALFFAVPCTAIVSGLAWCVGQMRTRRNPTITHRQ